MAWSFLSKRFQLHPFSVDLHSKREDLTLMIFGILVLVFVLFLFWLLRPTFLLLYALHTIKISIRERLKAVDDDSTPRFFSIYAQGRKGRFFNTIQKRKRLPI